MKILGNKVYINQGETFVLTFTFVNAKGEPIVINKNWDNPYCVITVSSCLYPQLGKYTRRYWLSLASYPKFESTTILPKPDEIPEAYQNVYYRIDESGNYIYEYYDGTSYKEYKFVITKTFINNDTSQWQERQYHYCVTLEAGDSTRQFLIDTYTSLYGEAPPDDMSNEQLYIAISKKDCELLKDFNYNAPIINCEVCQPLLTDGKIYVYIT